MLKRFKILRWLTAVVASVGMVAFGSLAISSPTAGAASITKKVVVSSTEASAVTVNWIFPFMTIAYFSVQNISFFQYYMYRPLYMFGGHNSPTLNKTLSLAKTPVASNGDKTFTIHLKTYKWSNTEKVSATDVLFWMNIWHQKPTGYAGWFPGGLSLPTSVASIKVTNPTTITFNMKVPQNPHWFLYNELSEITPLPLAWTKTSTTAAAGTAGCAKAAFSTTAATGPNGAKCKAVYDYLSRESGKTPTKPTTKINAMPTYATNPLWKVVDGPWTLKSFTATGPFMMVPNPKYSGPNKPKIKEFIEKPYTTSSAEFSALVSGTLDIGYLPGTEITQPAKRPAKVASPPTMGPNNPRLATTFSLEPLYIWGVNYFPYNFKSTGDTGNAGPIFSQLYFRQAMQRLVDQTLIISRLQKGYATPSLGPVPNLPKNAFLSKTETKNMYPFSVSAAKSLLKSHGWKIVPGGVDTCVKPGAGAGHCGKGVKKGAKLNFTLPYVSGTKTLTAEMDTEKSAWGEAGIHVNLSTETFNAVLSVTVPCKTKKSCKWEMGNWGGGWQYSPDIYPNATEILLKGAGSNDGDWGNPTSTGLLKHTITGKTKGNTALYKLENYLEKNLPYVWEPEPIQLWEVHKGLKGVAPMNPLNTNTPATYHWQ